jgi:hypothetical protein
MVKKDNNDDKKPKMRSMPRRDPKMKLGTRPMMPKTTSNNDVMDKNNDARGGRWRPKAQEEVKMRPIMPKAKTMMPGTGRWRPKAQEEVKMRPMGTKMPRTKK